MTNWNACRSPLDIGFLATLCPICFKPTEGTINPLFMGGNMKMGNLLLNMRYLLAPILIIVAGAGVLVGGIMAWLGVVLLFVGLLVDIATKFETSV